MSDKLSWGIIGTGAIARRFASELPASRTGQLVGVASRNQATAVEFAREFGAPKSFAGYETMLADPDVQAVYISTPHPMHAEWAIRAAEHGKHILCEKPITMNSDETKRLIEAARIHRVFLMEAFMYRCHPQTKRLCELVASGAIGEVRMIQATFSFQSEWNPESRLLNKPLGGGGILDVGCYCASMARMVAGAASGQPFAEPTELKAVGRVGETGVDEWTAAVLRFPGDIVAQLSCGVQLSQENVVRIYGSAGNILVPSPWFCGQDEAGANIVLRRGNETERISFADHRGLYAMEADTAAESIANGALEAYPPAMTWDDSVGNMRVLDRWRKELGV